MPAVSDGGKTYTYRIRPGSRFSPPSNQPVTAAAFRHAIERSLENLGVGNVPLHELDVRIGVRLEVDHADPGAGFRQVGSETCGDTGDIMIERCSRLNL